MRAERSLANEQVELFQERFNNEDWNAIVAEVDPQLLEASPEAEFVEFMGTVRGTLGKVTSTKTTRWNIQNTDGKTMVILVQESKFENGSGDETFTFSLKSEKASLLGYTIASKELDPE